MTSVQWVFRVGDTNAQRSEKIAAMRVADLIARENRSFPNDQITDLVREAVEIRRGEITWSDLAFNEPPAVKTRIAPMYWALLLAQFTIGVLASLFYFLLRT